MPESVPSLPDRAAELIADFEHASFNNAPISPVMLAHMKALVADALAVQGRMSTTLDEKTSAMLRSELASRHTLEIAQKLKAEADQLIADNQSPA